MPDVTVGIVLSSGPDLCREAIDCILDQDSVKVEVVVVGKGIPSECVGDIHWRIESQP